MVSIRLFKALLLPHAIAILCISCLANGQNCSIEYQGSAIEFDVCDTNTTRPIDIYTSLVNTTENGPEIDTVFRARLSGDGAAEYFSFGWGYNEMVSSSSGNVVMFASTTNGSDAAISPYSLQAKSAEGVIPTTISALADKYSAEINDGYIVVRFQQPTSGDRLPTIESIESVPYIWAAGLMTDGSSTQGEYHSNSGRGNGIFNLNSWDAIDSTDSKAGRIRAHSVIMAVTWTIIAPFSYITMRYLKKYKPTSFYIHRAFSIIAVTFTLIGLFLVVTDADVEGAHKYLGYIVTALVLFQVLMGIIRPAHDSKLRRQWGIMHLVFGTICVGLGYGSVITGIVLAEFDHSTVYYALTGIAIAACLVSNIVFLFQRDRFPLYPQKKEDDHAAELLEKGNSE